MLSADDAGTAPDPHRSRRGTGRGTARNYLELIAASGFAITQPLLSVFGRSPDEFIYRNASGWQIVGFALVVCIVPATVLWVVELVVGVASRRARDALHVVFLVALASLFVLQVLKKVTSMRGVAVVVLALVCGVAFGFVFVRIRSAQLWLRFASVAPIAFVVLFLIGSSVSPLILPSDAEAAKLGSSENAPSLVMVTFDEWPTASIVGADGNVDAELFPNLARLAGGTTWYRNYSSVTSTTYHALPSILTGRYPEARGIPSASSHPENLFTFLGGSYRLDVSEVVTRLCPGSLCTPPPSPDGEGLPSLLGEAGSVYRKMVSPNRSDTDVTARFEEQETEDAVAKARTAKGADNRANLDLRIATSNRPDRFTRFLASLHRDEKPTVHFLHILLPHAAYRYLPDGREYGLPDTEFGKVGDGWTTQPWPPALAHERMLLQTAYVDRLVGQLLDRLHSTGLYDRSVVVLTADHGVAFTPGEPSRGITRTPVPRSLYPQLLWTPLFVKASGQATGELSDANVMSIDVLPTIAQLLGFELPWKVDGVPAGERPASDTDKVFIKATGNGFGMGLDPPILFDGRAAEREMLAGNVDAITQPGDPALQLFRVGPEGVLVGRAVDDLARGERSRAVASLQQLDELHDVRSSDATVPAYLWGSLDRDATVAIAVNGRIAGVSPTFVAGDVTNRFAAMVPGSFLREGRNDVKAYEVTGTPEEPVLRAMKVEQSG